MDRYASLYFCMCVDADDNELETLEIIHHFVEILDRYFGNVSIRTFQRKSIHCFACKISTVVLFLVVQIIGDFYYVRIDILSTFYLSMRHTS